jgi:branched-subunit amino acid transport protein
MGTINNRRKRWNLLGFAISILMTIALVAFILYGNDHKGQLEVVFNILIAFLIVAAFAIITRNVKRICKNKLNKYSNE